MLSRWEGIELNVEIVAGFLGVVVGLVRRLRDWGGLFADYCDFSSGAGLLEF